MKALFKSFIFTIILLIAATTAPCNAQDITTNENFKFGKPTASELDMTQVESNPDAEAVILYDRTMIYYVYTDASGFQQVRENITRIKVLKDEGVRFADVELYLYNSNKLKTTYNTPTAYSFNKDENGKLVKSELKKNGIFKEKVSEHLERLKFTIPNVKAGSVIEYKTKVMTDDLYSVPSLSFQSSVPTYYASAEVSIPEFFRFRKNTWGYFNLNVKQSTDIEQVALGGGNYFSYNVDKTTFEAKGIPALKDEKLLWDCDSYRSHVDFTLTSVQFPNQTPKYYSHTWKDFFESLNNEYDYGSNLKMKNPLKEQLAPLLASATTEEEKIRAALKVVTGSIKWDGKYSIYSKNPQSALKKGEGNSADINFLLIATLKDAGIKCSPLMLNPRNRQRLVASPSLENINYFIVEAVLDSGRKVYLDGTNKLNDINIFSKMFMVDKAVPFNDYTGQNFVDLTNLTRNTRKINNLANINPENETITVKQTGTFTNLNAYYKNIEIDEFSSEEDYVKNISEKMTSGTYENVSIEKTNSNVKISTTLTLPNENDGTMMYLNPLVIPMEVPWTLNEQKRMYPVEFPQTEEMNIVTTLVLPEAWEVADMPQAIRISACQNMAYASYACVTKGNIVQISYTYKLNKVLFNREDYNDLVQFFNQISNVLESKIVLQKQE